MKSIFAALFILIGVHGQSAAAEEDVETTYRNWIQASFEGNYEESLRLGMVLFHKALEPPHFGHFDTPPHITMLFDIAQNLIYLKRWDEAKFCLKLFLVHIETDEEIGKTFGTDFSKDVWLRENWIGKQPFYRKSLPAG